MLLVCVDSINFKLNKDTQTVRYAEEGKRIAGLANSKEKLFNNIKAVIAENRETAVKLLRHSVQDFLNKLMSVPPKYADFTFSIVESDITEKTYLWLIPCLTNCKEYSVEEEQTNE